MVAPHKVVN
jgi:hypothetical protein